MFRRIIIVLCALSLPLLAHPQNKNTQRLFLKDGRALSGAVTITENGSYQIETIDGDIFFFESNEVEGVIGLPWEKDAKKKGIKPDDVVFRKGNQLYSVKTNQPLTQHDFNTMTGWYKYEKARIIGKAGRICMYSGAGTLVLSWGIMFCGSDLSSESLQIAEFIAGCVGFASGITGLIMTLNSNSKLKIMANAYNDNPGYVLNFGVQKNGIGFALNF